MRFKEEIIGDLLEMLLCQYIYRTCTEKYSSAS
jgi:hypothetical protein